MAQQSFHIAPRTGRATLCRRAESTCGFGGKAVHYGSKLEAESALREQREELEQLILAAEDMELRSDGYLESDYGKLAAPRGVYCPHCGAGPDERQGLLLLCYDRIECSCGESYDLDSIRVELLPGSPSYRFLDRDETLSATWYHATGDSDWLSEIRSTGIPFEVHLGTEAAAFDRAICEYASHQGMFARNFYLYEVELDPKSRVSSVVARDSNSAVLQGTRSHVARYLNLWEDMASISLAVKPEMVRIKSKRLVPIQEAHWRISLYNVAPPGAGYL